MTCYLYEGKGGRKAQDSLSQVTHSRPRPPVSSPEVGAALAWSFAHGLYLGPLSHGTDVAGALIPVHPVYLLSEVKCLLAPGES